MNEPGFMPDGLGGRLPLLDCGGAGREVRRLSLPAGGDVWDDGQVAVQARGCDVVVDVPGAGLGALKPRRALTVRMVGDRDGSVIVRGAGWVNAVREGGGAGDAVRECGVPDGRGNARRSGSGPGNAVVRGHSGAALAHRNGSGDGHALGLEPLGEGWCNAQRNGAGRGFALTETAVRFDDEEEAEAALDLWLASRPRNAGLPGDFPWPVAAFVEVFAASVPFGVLSAGQLASMACAGEDGELEWEQFRVMLNAMAGLCQTVDVVEYGPLSRKSDVAERWRDFALAFGTGSSVQTEYGRLAGAIALQLDSGLPPEPEVVNAQVEGIRELADALVCLDAVAARGREGPSGEGGPSDLLVASGYLREAAVRVDRVARLSPPACDMVGFALLDAAEIARGREPSPGPGR